MFIASPRCLQQRNEIMQSFFVAVNNLLKKFFRSTRRQPLRDIQPVNNFNHPETRTTSTSPPLHTPRRRFRFGAASCSEGRILGGFPELGNTFVVTR
ncbi:hypothetical protein [Ralstonia mannitolilytica]|uniref:hypothetical protein n=1 Tax=Ralstonia mannitolilytica TaxID=105219 RepID=UPI0015E15854|nr:hypothetical protein [Ralstonia mannitolilytica]